MAYTCRQMTQPVTPSRPPLTIANAAGPARRLHCAAPPGTVVRHGARRITQANLTVRLIANLGPANAQNSTQTNPDDSRLLAADSDRRPAAMDVFSPIAPAHHAPNHARRHSTGRHDRADYSR